MIIKEVFVGLGGNVGDVYTTFLKALEYLSAIPAIQDIKMSNVYQTTPVSDIPQALFLNSICGFSTSLTAMELLRLLQSIQIRLGQMPKPKNAPRIIDLDILFFGDEIHHSPELEIPHPKWSERLFVLVPLLDLIKSVKVPGPDRRQDKLIDLKEMIQNFQNNHEESIILWTPQQQKEG